MDPEIGLITEIGSKHCEVLVSGKIRRFHLNNLLCPGVGKWIRFAMCKDEKHYLVEAKDDHLNTWIDENGCIKVICSVSCVPWGVLKELNRVYTEQWKEMVYCEELGLIWDPDRLVCSTNQFLTYEVRVRYEPSECSLFLLEAVMNDGSYKKCEDLYENNGDLFINTLPAQDRPSRREFMAKRFSKCERFALQKGILIASVFDPKLTEISEGDEGYRFYVWNCESGVLPVLHSDCATLRSESTCVDDHKILVKHRKNGYADVDTLKKSVGLSFSYRQCYRKLINEDFDDRNYIWAKNLELEETKAGNDDEVVHITAGTTVASKNVDFLFNDSLINQLKEKTNPQRANISWDSMVSVNTLHFSNMELSNNCILQLMILGTNFDDLLGKSARARAVASVDFKLLECSWVITRIFKTYQTTM